MELLKFSPARDNGKLEALSDQGYQAYTFNLPAGHSCPAALECLAKVSRDGKLKDGAKQVIRCFAAMHETVYPATRAQRWHNFDLLKGKSSEAMAKLIQASLPAKASAVRIHVSGDFFNASYFKAWCTVARNNPQRLFYAYTKMIALWLDNLSLIPANLVLTASFGGRFDHLIEANGLKSARVVFSVSEAKELGLPIDHDDSHAIDPTCKAFALLIHSQQPAGSEAQRALRALDGLGSYAHRNKALNRQRALAAA